MVAVVAHLIDHKCLHTVEFDGAIVHQLRQPSGTSNHCTRLVDQLKSSKKKITDVGRRIGEFLPLRLFVDSLVDAHYSYGGKIFRKPLEFLKEDAFERINAKESHEYLTPSIPRHSA